jgi:hypothetical protein
MSVINLSESVKTAVRVAQSLAKEYHHKEFGPAHLLKGLMHQEVGLRNFLNLLVKMQLTSAIGPMCAWKNTPVYHRARRNAGQRCRKGRYLKKPTMYG